MTIPRDDKLVAAMQPIARKQVSTEAARQIQQLIATRQLREGDRLPTERELAEALQVSRNAVREGLKHLAALEIVHIRQGAGIFVKRPQHLALIDASGFGTDERRRLLQQATTARRVIDCAVVEQATAVVTDEDIAALRAYLEQADSEPVKTRLAHSIDLTFESMIGAMCHNPYLMALQDEAHRYFRTIWNASGLMPRPSEERSEQHWQILDAMETRDPAQARRLMERHFQLQGLEKT